jgi:hypothetical protein
MLARVNVDQRLLRLAIISNHCLAIISETHALISSSRRRRHRCPPSPLASVRLGTEWGGRVDERLFSTLMEPDRTRTIIGNRYHRLVRALGPLREPPPTGFCRQLVFRLWCTSAAKLLGGSRPSKN